LSFDTAVAVIVELIGCVGSDEGVAKVGIFSRCIGLIKQRQHELRISGGDGGIQSGSYINSLHIARVVDREWEAFLSGEERTFVVDSIHFLESGRSAFQRSDEETEVIGINATSRFEVEQCAGDWSLNATERETSKQRSARVTGQSVS